MAYELEFHIDYAFSIPFAHVMFPDDVWDGDLIENTVLVIPMTIYASKN